MSLSQASKTATLAAVVRAAHTKYDDHIVFSDTFAINFVGSFWKFIISNSFLHWLFRKKLFSFIEFIQLHIIYRARYSEDILESLVPKGIDQYVIMGAGYDSFCLRQKDLIKKISVYELDHPATQKEKKRILKETNQSVTSNFEFVEIDFEKVDIQEALSNSSFSPTKPTFFSWMGTTSYLTDEAIFNTLKNIRSICVPGSELIIDYPIAQRHIGKSANKNVNGLRMFLKGRGEPLSSLDYDSENFASRACELGFEVVENISLLELYNRYANDTKAKSSSMLSGYFVRLRAV